MQIADIAVVRHDFQLRNPSVVAYEAVEIAPNLVVRIELENGLVGWGNAAPDEHVTGENADGVERTLNKVLKPFLLGQFAQRIEAIWPRLCQLAPNQPTAIAAVDIALYDLLGKAAGLPPPPERGRLSGRGAGRPCPWPRWCAPTAAGC